MRPACGIEALDRFESRSATQIEPKATPASIGALKPVSFPAGLFVARIDAHDRRRRAAVRARRPDDVLVDREVAARLDLTEPSTDRRDNLVRRRIDPHDGARASGRSTQTEPAPTATAMWSSSTLSYGPTRDRRHHLLVGGSMRDTLGLQTRWGSRVDDPDRSGRGAIPSGSRSDRNRRGHAVRPRVDASDRLSVRIETQTAPFPAATSRRRPATAGTALVGLTW